MAMALQLIGGAMLVYMALYTARFLFSALYDEPQRVQDVVSVIPAVGILVALAANLEHLRALPEGQALARSGSRGGPPAQPAHARSCRSRPAISSSTRTSRTPGARSESGQRSARCNRG